MMVAAGRMINGHWYDLERTGLTKRKAIEQAATWERNRRFHYQRGRRKSGGRFYAVAAPFEGKYAVFVRTN